MNFQWALAFQLCRGQLLHFCNLNEVHWSRNTKELVSFSALFCQTWAPDLQYRSHQALEEDREENGD